MVEITTNVEELAAGKAQDCAYEEHASALAFAPTLQRLTELIERAGLTLFATIDHAEAARNVGLSMPPTAVLIYGNPRGGTPIMLMSPRAALDLPLRMLVREDEKRHVFVAFHPIALVLREAGVAAEVAARLVSAQSLLVEGVRS